jgi:hypothetical protein
VRRGRPARNREARSSCQLKRFRHIINPDKVFGTHSHAYLYVTEKLAAVDADAQAIDLDLSGTSWEFLLKDIVKRSTTLSYVSVITAFTWSKMRPDGFGGMIVLITRDAIVGKSTNDLLEDFLAAAGLDGHEVPEAEASDTSRPH